MVLACVGSVDLWDPWSFDRCTSSIFTLCHLWRPGRISWTPPQKLLGRSLSFSGAIALHHALFRRSRRRHPTRRFARDLRSISTCEAQASTCNFCLWSFLQMIVWVDTLSAYSGYRVLCDIALVSVRQSIQVLRRRRRKHPATVLRIPELRHTEHWQQI